MISSINDVDGSEIQNLKITLVQKNKKLNKIECEYGDNKLTVTKINENDKLSYNVNLEIKNTQSNNLIKQVNENFKTCINSIDSNKTININEITVPMSNKTPLREYNLWIMEYASIIVDEINKSIENETFKKLNQNL